MKEGCFLGLALLLSSSLLGCGLYTQGYSNGQSDGINRGQEVERAEAVSAGAAEWRIDPKTGERSFHYLTPCGEVAP